MQNVWLKKDFTLIVFDGEIGLANNQILPSGPLRQSLASGLKSADLVVFNGPDKTGLQEKIGDSVACLHTQLIVNPVTAVELKGKTVLGFAGIGRPERFFETLRDTGANVLHTRPFADHHLYSDADLTRLYMEANQLGAQLVTTQKDWVRLPPEWRERILAMDVSIQLGHEQSEMLLSRINAVLTEKKS